jgi:hypothetical protein
MTSEPGMAHYVSAYSTHEDWTSGKIDEIDVFREQFEGWLLVPSRTLRTSDPDTHSVALVILISTYFEAIACYMKGRAPGRGQSTMFLKDGLKAVFPSVTSEEQRLFADEVRNGVFHEACFRNASLSSQHTAALKAGTVSVKGKGGSARVIRVIEVNPHLFHDAVEAHFRAYVAALRSGSEPKLSRFQQFFSLRKDRK